MDIKEEAAALYKAAVKIVEAEYAMMCSVHPASVRPVYRGIQCMDDLRETVFRLSCDAAWDVFPVLLEHTFRDWTPEQVQEAIDRDDIEYIQHLMLQAGRTDAAAAISRFYLLDENEAAPAYFVNAASEVLHEAAVCCGQWPWYESFVNKICSVSIKPDYPRTVSLLERK